MAQQQVTIKTSIKAKKLIRVVAALAGEKQYELLERLLEQERNRLLPGIITPPGS